MDRAPDTDFGRYRMVAEPTYYGAGSLVAARELRSDEPRQLWLLMPHVVSEPAIRERVVRVATTLRRVASAHLLPLHEFGEIEGQPFFAFGTVDGLDLVELTDPDGLGLLDALEVIAQLGTGLSHLHHAGVIDGALGPRRVVVTEDGDEVRAVIRHAGLLSALLPTSALFGTQKQEALDHGAPELHRGEAPTVRSDVYSLGSLLWLALTGETPFPSYVGHRAAEVPQVAGDGPLEEAVNAVLRKAMAKDPAERYRDTGAFVATLRSVAALAREVESEAVPERLVRREVPAPLLDPAPLVDPTPLLAPEVVPEEGPEEAASANQPDAAPAAPYDPGPETTVEPALRTAMDRWNERRTVTIRRRRGNSVKGLLGAALIGGVILSVVVGVRVLGPTGEAPTPGLPNSARTTATGTTTAAPPIATLFPIAGKGHCVEDARTAEGRVERWTCDRRGYRVVLTRWEQPSMAATRVPHGGDRGAREVWRIDGERVGTQWTWRAAGERNRFRWTAVYDDVPYAVTIEATSAERRRHARGYVVFRPSTVLG